MFRFLTLTLIVLFLAVFAKTCVANSFVVGPAANPMPVGVWTSQTGETKDHFVQRVAAAVYPITRQTGFEICGNLMVSRDGTRYRLPMVNDGSHVGCRTLRVPQPGFVFCADLKQQETLHTHPRAASFSPNAQDIALFPTSYGANPRMRYPVDGDKFSALDIQNGAGYVVASGAHPFGSGHLLYQNGPGTVREVGSLKGFSVADLAPDADSGSLGEQMATVLTQTPEILTAASP